MEVRKFLSDKLKDYGFKNIERGTYYKYNDKGQGLDDCIDALLDLLLDEEKEVSPIQDYQITTEEVDCGPGYETGFVFIAWLDRKDNLNTFTIQWEIY